MKKITIYLAAIIAIIGCEKESVLMSENNIGYITASTPSEDLTKTSLVKDGDHNWVYWKTGDVLNVIGKTDYEDHIYTLSEGEGTTTGVFASSNPCSDNNLVFASYPQGVWLDASKGNYYLSIPYSQQYVENGIEDGILPMYAQGSPSSLSFNHIAAILRVKAYSTSPVTLSKIMMASSSKIAGEDGVVFVKSSGASKVLEYNNGIRSSKAKYEISLDCAGVELSTNSATPTEFNFVVFANDSGSGYTISDLSFTFYEQGSNRSFRISKSSSKTYYAGKIYPFDPVNCKMGYTGIELLVDGTPADIENIPTPNSSVFVNTTTGVLTSGILNNIISAISTSESNCIELDLSGADYEKTKWDIILNSASKISVLKLPKNVTTFENLLEHYFRANLTDIYIPASMTATGSQPFYYAAARFHVDPNNPTYSNDENGWLLNKAGDELCLISGARYYQTLNIPEGIRSLKGYMFNDNCNALTKIILPSTLELIDRDAFILEYALNTIDCRALTSVPSWPCPYGTLPAYGKNATNDRQIVVPSSLIDDFQFAGEFSGWQILKGLFTTNPWTYISADSYTETPSGVLTQLSVNNSYNNPDFFRN